ncbi:hypothetical protein MLD38_033300 [Melastoma candidum]|uniref:Uncharacterized protein n=1 Tax=Melastoma candidum TaxID=119954 RepID=A0ACB9M856_9MYRT|nr:hypothetical protein MLD38_033300 [Melastoma candidum]
MDRTWRADLDIRSAESQSRSENTNPRSMKPLSSLNSSRLLLVLEIPLLFFLASVFFPHPGLSISFPASTKLDPPLPDSTVSRFGVAERTESGEQEMSRGPSRSWTGRGGQTWKFRGEVRHS